MLTLQIDIDRLSQHSVVRLRKSTRSAKNGVETNNRWNGTADGQGHDGYRAREALTYLFVAICHDKDKLL